MEDMFKGLDKLLQLMAVGILVGGMVLGIIIYELIKWLL